jgi:homoserine kinase
MSESIRVFAPATVANVSCGFDVLGFAVNAPGDELVLRKKATPGIEIAAITGDGGKLPTHPDQNTASVSIQHLLRHLGIDQGFSLELHKKMPLGSGMGSSAASAVAGVFAANAILGNPLPVPELLPFAMEGERLACGAAHADNVAPSLIGGLVLIRSYEPLDVVSIPTPLPLYCTLLHPDIQVRTEDARAMLRRDIPMKRAIQQWGNLAGLVAGFMMGDASLISRSMHDVVVEPIRSILIPGFQDIKAAAMATGALGCSISGSGPAIFALSPSESTAREVGRQMQGVLASLNIRSEVFVSPINYQGPSVLD